MALTSKKVARPTTRRLNEEPDPVGFGTTLAEIIAELKDTYRARLHAFLRVFLLVKLCAGRTPEHARRDPGAGRAGPCQLRPQGHNLSSQFFRILSHGGRAVVQHRGSLAATSQTIIHYTISPIHQYITTITFT